MLTKEQLRIGLIVASVLLGLVVAYYVFRFGIKIGDTKSVTSSTDTNGDGVPDAFVDVQTTNFVDAMAEAFDNSSDGGTAANSYLNRLNAMNDTDLKSVIIVWRRKYQGEDGTFGYFAWKPLGEQIASLYCRKDWFGNKNLDCQLRDSVAQKIANLSQQL